MAFTNSLSFTQNANDNEIGVVADLTDYGISGNPLRSAKANYLLWSKTDKNGVRAFSNPDQGNVLSNLAYTVATLTDGHYEGILMRFELYDNVAAYVEEQSSGGIITQYASIVYYNGFVYKCTVPSTGNLPTDTNFWIVVTDLSTLIDNTTVDVFIEDFYVKVRANQCANAKFAADCGCGCDGDLSKIRSALEVRYKIVAADAAFANGNPERMEKIIRDIALTCATC